MNRYQKAIKYTKPLTEIDAKINRLNEMMTTTGMYVQGQHIDAQREVLPTREEIPDGSLGDFSDLNSFTQNADTDNVNQLSSNDAEGTSVPITEVQDTSSFDFASGVSARAMARHSRAETGTVYGFIDSQNVFNEIFVIGGLRPSGRGESNIIDAGLDWYFANIDGKTVETVGWKCYNPPRLQDALYTPLAENVGPGGNYMLHSNELMFVKNQNFMTDAGNPHRPARFNVLSRNDLGDPNYYPGPVRNVSPEAINYLLSRIPPYVGRPPRNSPGPGPQNVQGPHQPIKYYPGMGFGPAGPVQPGGFYANSYEPEGEVLSEDLTKNDFARLNKYVKDHPEELEYAFSRYPASDPRLSQLNFKMDDMMRASNDYVDKQFPENIDRTSRVKKILARNIELSDPKTFKEPKQPMTYGKVFKSGTAKKYAKRNAVKKRANNLYTKTLAHTDMKRVKEMHEEKIKEEKIAQILREQQEIRAELAEIEAEESKYVNWRKELAEGMTTSGLGMINLPAEGDVDLESISSRVSPSGSSDGYSQSGSTYTFGPQSGEVNGSSLTMTIDAKKYDTLKFDFTAGTIDTLEVTTTSGDYILSATSGTKTITLRDRDKRSGLTVAFYVQRGDGLQSVGTNVIRNLAFQRRTPLNVLVPLDDPEANSFMRGGLGGDKERRAKLKDMLEAGNEYLSKYTNITPSQTTPGDIELAQLSPQTEKNIDAMLLKGLERGDYGSGPQIQKQIDSLKRNMRQGTPGGIPKV